MKTVKSMIEINRINKDILIREFDNERERLKRECAYWAREGNKSKLSECQKQFKVLDDIITSALHYSNN